MTCSFLLLRGNFQRGKNSRSSGSNMRNQWHCSQTPPQLHANSRTGEVNWWMLALQHRLRCCDRHRRLTKGRADDDAQKGRGPFNALILVNYQLWLGGSQSCAVVFSSGDMVSGPCQWLLSSSVRRYCIFSPSSMVSFIINSTNKHTSLCGFPKIWRYSRQICFGLNVLPLLNCTRVHTFMQGKMIWSGFVFFGKRVNSLDGPQWYLRADLHRFF